MNKNTLIPSKLPTRIVDAYSRKTILISGAFGYIGSALTQSLSQIDCHLLLLDKLPQAPWLSKNQRAKISIFQKDVSIKKTWKALLPGVNYLFHLAALEYNRSKYSLIRDLKTNALSVIHLLETCRQYNFHPKIIFSSSANLFGLVDTLPVNEKIPSHPISLWSVHKLMAENYFYVHAKKYGIESITLRLSNIYGQTVNQKAMTNVVINKIITRALDGEPLTLYANQNCIRDYVFLEDVVNAFLYAGTQEKLFDGRFYIVGTGEGKTIAEVWKLIAKKIKIRTGKSVTIKVDESVKLEPLDMRNFIADTTAFSRATKWKSRVFLEKGIKLTINALMLMKKGKHEKKAF